MKAGRPYSPLLKRGRGTIRRMDAERRKGKRPPRRASRQAGASERNAGRQPKPRIHSAPDANAGGTRRRGPKTMARASVAPRPYGPGRVATFGGGRGHGGAARRAMRRRSVRDGSGRRRTRTRTPKQESQSFSNVARTSRRTAHPPSTRLTHSKQNRIMRDSSGFGMRRCNGRSWLPQPFRRHSTYGARSAADLACLDATLPPVGAGEYGL